MYKHAYIDGMNQGFLNLWYAHPSRVSKTFLGGTRQTTLLLDSYCYLRMGRKLFIVLKGVQCLKSLRDLGINYPGSDCCGGVGCLPLLRVLTLLFGKY